MRLPATRPALPRRDPPRRARPADRSARPAAALRAALAAAGLVGMALAAQAQAQTLAQDGAAPTGQALIDGSADCRLMWQIRPRLDSRPRQLELTLRFEAGGRQRSTLRLPAGWDGVVELPEAGATARLQPVPGDPQLRSVAHAPGERVLLRWRLTPPPGSAVAGSVQLAERWFALAGLGALPLPEELDERAPPSACVGLEGLPADSRWASSHGSAEGASALLRIAPGPQPLRQRVQQAIYAGGALQLRAGPADAPPLSAVLPEPGAGEPGWRFDADALAAAGAQALAAQRRQWGDSGSGAPWLLLALPGAGAAPSAAAWHQALVLQAGPDTGLPGPAADAALYAALARARVAERFGPLAHSGRGDGAARAWFSEGFADFLAHRALLREGRWRAEDYAAALNRKLERYLDLPDRALDNAALTTRLADAGPGSALAELPAARGEWLALHWHNALRAAGQPGLEALLRGLQVPAAQARREGPLSAPLATHRLLAALRRVLDEQPMADLGRHIERGEPFDFGPQTLGPCFQGGVQSVATWRLGFDPASLTRRVVAGVEPGGPAEAAGLRDGQAIAGHALVPGDPTVPVQLQLREPDGRLRELSYLPADGPARPRLRYTPLAQALQQAGCQGWLGLGAEAQRAATATPATAGRGAVARQAAAADGPARSGKASKAGKSAKSGKPAASGARTPAGSKGGRPGAGAKGAQSGSKAAKPGTAAGKKAGTAGSRAHSAR